MHARLLDVLHDPADPHAAATAMLAAAVAERVHVHLRGVLEKAVEEDLALLARLAMQVVGQPLARVDDLHRPPSEHVGRAHEQREAHVLAALERLRDRARRRERGRPVAEALEQRAETAAVLREVDRLHARSEQRDAGGRQSSRELQRRLPAELHDHALGLLDLDHGQHVGERQGLEVQPVGGVVVGRDRLGIAVDHDRVAARFAHGHGGVHAAVVELDPLPDPVGPGAKDHHRRTPLTAPGPPSWGLLACASRGGARRAGDLSRLPARVVVGGARRELRRARVHRAVAARARKGPLGLQRERLKL